MRRVREGESVMLKVLMDRRLGVTVFSAHTAQNSVDDSVIVWLLVVYFFPRKPSRKPQSACEHLVFITWGVERGKQSLH